MPVLSGGGLLSIYRDAAWDSPWPKAASNLDRQLPGSLSSQQAVISPPHRVRNDCSSLGTNVFLWYVRLSINSLKPE